MNVAMETGAEATRAPTCAEAAGAASPEAPAVAPGSRLESAAAFVMMLLLAIAGACLACEVYGALDNGRFVVSGPTLWRILAVIGI